MADPTTNQGVIDALAAGPGATYGYGPRENIDDTRQAQHMEANDAPVDINMNAALARVQGQTLAQIGEFSAANQDFRQKVQDRFLSKVQ